MKNVGLTVSWTDFLMLQVVLASLQRRVQLQVTSIQIVNSNYVCLVHNQMCHTQKRKFCTNEVDKYML